MSSIEYVRTVDGERLAIHGFDGLTSNPTLLIHGTSFHAEVLGPLATAITGISASAVDLRGHGRSSIRSIPGFRWQSLGDDAGAALSHLLSRSSEAVFGIGHSAGATALLLAASKEPGRFRRLYCYEPIALNAGIREMVALPLALSGAARRRARFASREEAFAHFSARPPLSGLDPSVLHAYVEGGLVDDDQGGLRLACDPEFEAAVYRAGYEADVYDEIRKVQCPVTIAYGDAEEGIGSACAPVVVADALPHGELVVLEGLGHLGPLVNPSAVAASIITAFDTARA